MDDPGSPPIPHALFVHGAGGGAWEWNVWRGVFEAAGVRTVALDLQPVPQGVAATCLADYVRQVRDELQRLPRPRALVGASLGGLLALACADEADAIVLVNPMLPAPWSEDVPSREWPEVVHWGRDARLASARDALHDADPATALFALRHWRDESGAVLREAHAGVVVERPACRLLMLVSGRDEDVPPMQLEAMAEAWRADIVRRPEDSHVGPLLGRGAATCATQALAWLSAR